jgi:hypothetical protein
MTREEALDRMLAEIQTKGIQCLQNYIPTSDHYIPLRLLTYYLYLAYGVGYDAAKIQTEHGNKKRIKQMSCGECIKIWNSQTDAARELHMSVNVINNALIRKSMTKNGFKWEYENS